MRGFKEWMRIAQGELPPTQERYLFFHFASDDPLAKFILGNLLLEDAKHLDLGKGREVFFHKAHVPQGQDHLHFYQRNAKLYAINVDGTAHDQSHGKQMAGWAVDAVKDNYPRFTLPKDGLIEALLQETSRDLLLEGTGSKEILVPAALRALALTEAGKE